MAGDSSRDFSSAIISRWTAQDVSDMAEEVKLVSARAPSTDSFKLESSELSPGGIPWSGISVWFNSAAAARLFFMMITTITMMMMVVLDGNEVDTLKIKSKTTQKAGLYMGLVSCRKEQKKKKKKKEQTHDLTHQRPGNDLFDFISSFVHKLVISFKQTGQIRLYLIGSTLVTHKEMMHYA